MTVTDAAPGTPATRVRRAAPLTAVERLRTTQHDDRLTVTAWMRVDPQDPHLAGHFPGTPIYPGVFVVETLCQAVSAALGAAPRLQQVTSVRFLAPLLGGDELELTLDVTAQDAAGDPVPPAAPPAGPRQPARWEVRAVGHRRDGAVTTRLRAVFDCGPRP